MKRAATNEELTPDDDPGPPRSRPPELPFPAVIGPKEAPVVGVYREIAASQWWPAEAIRRAQFAQLARLVEHARRHVPFYAERLDPLRTGPDGTIDEAAWAALPLLTKSQVREQSANLKSRHLDPHEKAFAGWTTGSTGAPLEVLTTSTHWMLFRALKLRLFQWQGNDFTGKFIDIHPASGKNPSGTIRRFPQWAWPLGELFRTGEQLDAYFCTEVSDQVDLLEREAPRYLTMRPSNLRLLLRAFRKSGRRLPSLRMMRTRGETLSAGLRKECMEVLGVPIVDAYGATEAGYIAIQCPGHDHYHVQSETNLVEILRDDGTPCDPGESGRVVVTPLHALAMPLLRYDLGDYAEAGEPCPCGRGLPVLRRILGKERELLTLPSGRKRPSTAAVDACEGVPAVAQFQIVQTQLAELELRIVAERPLTEAESDQITARLAGQLGPGFTIQLVFVDEIPRLPGGKCMEFVSELEAAR